MSQGIQGPPAPLRRDEARLRRRIQKQLGLDAIALRRESIAEWARNDDAPFPTEEKVKAQAQFELETLFHALGGLAALEGSEVFMMKSSWMDELFGL